MSKHPRNLNAVFGRFRRRMLAAELPTGAVERRDIGKASEPARRTMPATPDPPPRQARRPIRVAHVRFGSGARDSHGQGSCAAERGNHGGAGGHALAAGGRTFRA